MPNYVWEKSFTIAAASITCDIDTTGIPEVRYEQTTMVTILNGRLVASSGKVTVEILKDNVVATTLLNEHSITIPAEGQWRVTHPWIPDTATTYTVRVTYVEALTG